VRLEGEENLLLWSRAYLFACKDCLLTIVGLMLKKHKGGTNKHYGNYLFNYIHSSIQLYMEPVAEDETKRSRGQQW
jgi:hypothetical protein